MHLRLWARARMGVHVRVLVWESHMLQNGSPEGVRDCLRQSVRSGRRGNARNGAAFRGNDGEWMRGETMRRRWRWGRQFWDKIEGSRAVRAPRVTQGRWNLTYSADRPLLPPSVPLCRREHPSQPVFCRVVLTASVQCWLFPFSPWGGGDKGIESRLHSLRVRGWNRQLISHRDTLYPLPFPSTLRASEEKLFRQRHLKPFPTLTHTHTQLCVVCSQVGYKLERP